MDSAILALAIKVYKKLVSFIANLQGDFYGTGEMGNCIVTTNSQDEKITKSGWKQLVPQNLNVNGSGKDIYRLPISITPQFNNLIIDTNTIFTTTDGVAYLFLYVRDTLTIRAGASVSMNNKGANSSNFAPFLPNPGIGQSTNPYKTACLRMFVSGRDIKNTYDLTCYGGNLNSVSGISGGGTAGAGGGVLALYYKGSLKDQNDNIYINTSSNIRCNGGSGADFLGRNTGGGMLFIFAKNIILDTSASISCDGGNGSGKISYWRGVPDQSINSSTGGGGVVIDVPMRVN